MPAQLHNEDQYCPHVAPVWEGHTLLTRGRVAQEKTIAAVTQLTTTLDAELEVVDGEEDAGVQQVAPSPKVRWS
jgi:hypothetical protein